MRAIIQLGDPHISKWQTGSKQEMDKGGDVGFFGKVETGQGFARRLCFVKVFPYFTQEG